MLDGLSDKQKILKFPNTMSIQCNLLCLENLQCLQFLNCLQGEHKKPNQTVQNRYRNILLSIFPPITSHTTYKHKSTYSVVNKIQPQIDNKYFAQGNLSFTHCKIRCTPTRSESLKGANTRLEVLLGPPPVANVIFGGNQRNL